MSNFSQLKSMWQNKSKVQTNVAAPIRPLPQKKPAPIVQSIQPPIQASTANTRSSEAAKQSKVSNNSGSGQNDTQKKTVAQLRKNLQGVLKLGFNNPKMSQYQVNSSYKAPQQIINQPQQAQKNAKDIIPLKGAERMPTFQQSKANLQKIFQKRKIQQEIPIVNQNKNSQVIDLKKQENQHQNLSPQERSQQIMKRIFSNTDSQTVKNISPEFNHQQSDQTHEKNAFLNKDQQAKNLNLRGAKKQKKILGDFDDS